MDLERRGIIALVVSSRHRTSVEYQPHHGLSPEEPAAARRPTAQRKEEARPGQGPREPDKSPY